jgi:hypothetical protein
VSEAYLVWSHEHGRWWGPGRSGYTRRLSEAGRYTRAEAVAICAKAIPGNAARYRSLPELPVREEDVLAMREAYRQSFPTLTEEEPWE